MIHLLWIVVVTLITFSVILAKPQWSEKIISKRIRANDKYKLPANFWSDLNEIELMLSMMNEKNAKSVFNEINKWSDKYIKYYMNSSYDHNVSRIIQKYNAKVFLLTKNQVKWD